MPCNGMGSGDGASSASQASVHGLRSCRDGLPVRERERTVSREVAANIFSFTTGLVSASAVVSQTEPHHAPAAPMLMAAAICAPVVMPPAANTGVSAPGAGAFAIARQISGLHQHHGGHLAAMAAGFGSEILPQSAHRRAAATCAIACCLAPTNAPVLTPCCAAMSSMLCGIARPAH